MHWELVLLKESIVSGINSPVWSWNSVRLWWEPLQEQQHHYHLCPQQRLHIWTFSISKILQMLILHYSFSQRLPQLCTFLYILSNNLAADSNLSGAEHRLQFWWVWLWYTWFVPVWQTYSLRRSKMEYCHCTPAISVFQWQFNGLKMNMPCVHLNVVAVLKLF